MRGEEEKAKRKVRQEWRAGKREGGWGEGCYEWRKDERGREGEE